MPHLCVITSYSIHYTKLYETKPSDDCETHAIQSIPTKNGNRYLLGFIEFDDQGQLWDRKQMFDVVGKLAGDTGTP